MKKIQTLSTAMTLVLVFTISAFAGQMETDFNGPPPPPPDQTQALGGSSTITGQMDTDGQIAIMVTAVGVLESILPLF